MAGAFIELTIANSAEVKAAFEALQAKLADLTPVFQDIGEEMLNRTRDRFRSHTAPDGEKWADLDKDYAKRKKKNADKILTLSGNLRGLLTVQAGPRSVRIGTPLIYGAAHQFGRPDINLTPRPFLGLSTSDEQELLDILRDHLNRAMNAP